MTKFNGKIKLAIAIVTAFVTSATAIILWEQLQLPRWAWFSEHKALAAEFHETELTRAQLKFYDLDREIQKYEQEKLRPPESLIKEWQSLLLKIRELCIKLEKQSDCAETG